METVDTVIFRAKSEIRGKSKRPDETRIYNFVKDFLDESILAMKTLEDRGVIINKPIKRGISFLLSKSLREPTDNDSNTINITPTVSLPSNAPVCPNCDTDISLLSEGIDSSELLFDTQLQNPTQMSPAKPTSKGTNTK